MVYVIRPEDILILFGLILVLTRQPFERYVSYASYASLKRKIPYAVQNPIYFGLVWYTLYLFIATAVFLIFLERASLHEWVAYAEFSLFAVIVITIYAWTPLFFGLHDYLQGLATTKGKKNASSVPPSTAHLLAFIDLLMLLIALTCFMFFAIFGDPSYSTGYWIPALLMGPVIAWVTYAGYLNLAAMVVSQD